METYSFELAEALKKVVDLSLHILPGQKNGSPPRMPLLIFFLFSELVKLTRMSRVDVIHVGDLVIWPLAYFAARFNKAPAVLVTAYGLELVYGRRKGFLPWVYKNYLSLGIWMCGKKIKILAISNATADLCRDAGFVDVAFVPLGVNIEAISRNYRDPHAEPFVLYVGRLVRRKGCAWFVREVLPKIHKDIRLVVVGKVWDEVEFKQVVASPRVNYIGYVDDIALSSLRRSAVAVIMPNISSDGCDIEGFGLTALEAIASGGVILASEIEGLKDAIIDGETGFLLNAEDAAPWVEKIHSIFGWQSSQRRKFIERAQQVVVEQFCWGRVAQDTVSAYMEISQQG